VFADRTGIGWTVTVTVSSNGQFGLRR
jgi:hypothetical protein